MLQFKTCNKCNQTKDISNFYKRKDVKNGYLGHCNICSTNKNKIYLHSVNGLISQIYSIQKLSSRRRNHDMPSYSKKELKDWILNNSKFKSLYEKWVKENYSNDLKPSIDRLNDYNGYSIDNIQLITWAENRDKNYFDMKNGINTKQSKSICQYSLEGLFIKEYHSINNANIETNVSSSSISKCCSGIYGNAGGFKWEYNNKDGVNTN